MRQEELVNRLRESAGPLAPSETQQDRESRQETWRAGLSLELVETFMALVRCPPAEEEIFPVAPRDFEFELIESLIAIGKQDPAPFLEQVGPLLVDVSLRATLIEVLGGLGTERSIQWLAPLIQVKALELKEQESIRLACALGELGGPDARKLLEQMRASTIADRSELSKEIDIAMRACEA